MKPHEAANIATWGHPGELSNAEWVEWLRENGRWKHRDLIRALVDWATMRGMPEAVSPGEMGIELRAQTHRQRLIVIKKAILRAKRDPVFAAACETVAMHGWARLGAFVKEFDYHDRPA